MSRTARSWLVAGAAGFIAAALFLWSIVYLGETITGPRTVPVDYTPTTAPRSVP